MTWVLDFKMIEPIYSHLYIYSVLKRYLFRRAHELHFHVYPDFRHKMTFLKQFSFTRTPLKVWKARINVCECLISSNSLWILDNRGISNYFEAVVFLVQKHESTFSCGKSFEQFSAHVSHLSTPAFIKRGVSMGDGTLKRSWKVL